MENTKEWWHQTFQMHAQLMESLDANLLQEFRQRLDSLPPYTYAKPREGLGIGAPFVKEIAGWFDDVVKWLEAKGDYVDAEKFLGSSME